MDKLLYLLVGFEHCRTFYFWMIHTVSSGKITQQISCHLLLICLVYFLRLDWFFFKCCKPRRLTWLKKCAGCINTHPRLVCMGTFLARKKSFYFKVCDFLWFQYYVFSHSEGIQNNSVQCKHYIIWSIKQDIRERTIGNPNMMMRRFESLSFMSRLFVLVRCVFTEYTVTSSYLLCPGCKHF